MIKLGVEYKRNNMTSPKFTLYKSEEKPSEEAQKLCVEQFSNGEYVTLFFTEVDDQGKPISNAISVMDVWCLEK